MTETRMLEPLSNEEARALGVLIEKEKTVPDSYPMSLNSLLAGCNQRTSRDPVMTMTEAQLLQALDGLRERSVVIESSGGRVMRYEHNLPRVLGISNEAAALLSMLMLRGPQTAAELRAHVERQVRFADTSSVEGYLNEMAERSAGALVTLMLRQPGAREQRWRHCLSVPAGEADSGQMDHHVAGDAGSAGHAATMAGGAGAGSSVAGQGVGAQAVSQRVDELQQRVQELETRLADVNARLAAIEEALR
ncbi:MAG: YceH family protein [Lautropia sp.]|nr:YceH family protein [Lautropia sp.]